MSIHVQQFMREKKTQNPADQLERQFYLNCAIQQSLG